MALSQRALDALALSEQPLSEVAATFKALLYGGIGSGKTYLAMQLAQKLTPSSKDIIYVDYAEGWTAVKNHKDVIDRTRRMQYDSMKHLTLLGMAIEEKAPGYSNVGCVVLDEYSSMVDNSLEDIVKEFYKKDPGKYDEYMPEWPHYNKNQIVCKGVHRKLNHLEGVHVIYVCHFKERIDKTTEQVFVEPNLNPMYEKLFLQDPQLIGYVEAVVKNNQYTRTVQVQPEKRVAAKNRLGLPTKVSPETLIESALKFVQTGKEVESAQPITIED